MKTQVTTSIFAEKLARMSHGESKAQSTEVNQPEFSLIFLSDEEGNVLHQQGIPLPKGKDKLPADISSVYWCNGSFGGFDSDGESKTFSFIHYLNDQLSFQLGLSIFNDLNATAKASDDYIESMTTSLGQYLMKLMFSYKPHLKGQKLGMTPFQIRKITNFVQQNIHGRIGLKDLADLVKLSPFHFSRMFKQTTGLTPYQYVIQCRLNKSVYHILNSSTSINQIAYDVGYESAGNFSRSFRKQFDITPSELRKMSSKETVY